MYDTLDELKSVIHSCNKCSLRENTIVPCWDSGNSISRVMFINEAQDIEDSKVGIPLIGKSGKYLNRLLAAIGIKRNDIFISNIVQCRPIKDIFNIDRVPTDSEMVVCSDYLINQIQLINPLLLVALGKISFKFLTGSNDAIFNAKGNLYNYQYNVNIKVFPVLHPSYLLSYGTPTLLSENWDDWLKLREVINELSA